MERTWSRHFDAASGAEYFVNDATGESSWEAPEGFTEAPGHVTAADSGAPPADGACGNGNDAQAVGGSGDAADAVGGSSRAALEWDTHFDEASGDYYYSNVTTGDVTWDKPTSVPDPHEHAVDPGGGTVLTKAAGAQSFVASAHDVAAGDGDNAVGVADAGSAGVEEWDPHLDEASGDYYYFNTVTGQVTWDKPASEAPVRQQRQRPEDKETAAEAQTRTAATEAAAAAAAAAETAAAKAVAAQAVAAEAAAAEAARDAGRHAAVKAVRETERRATEAAREAQRRAAAEAARETERRAAAEATEVERRAAAEAAEVERRAAAEEAREAERRAAAENAGEAERPAAVEESEEAERRTAAEGAAAETKRRAAEEAAVLAENAEEQKLQQADEAAPKAVGNKEDTTDSAAAAARHRAHEEREKDVAAAAAVAERTAAAKREVAERQRRLEQTEERARKQQEEQELAEAREDEQLERLVAAEWAERQRVIDAARERSLRQQQAEQERLEAKEKDVQRQQRRHLLQKFTSEFVQHRKTGTLVTEWKKVAGDASVVRAETQSRNKELAGKDYMRKFWNSKSSHGVIRHQWPGQSKLTLAQTMHQVSGAKSPAHFREVEERMLKLLCVGLCLRSAGFRRRVLEVEARRVAAAQANQRRGRRAPSTSTSENHNNNNNNNTHDNNNNNNNSLPHVDVGDEEVTLTLETVQGLARHEANDVLTSLLVEKLFAEVDVFQRGYVTERQLRAAERRLQIEQREAEPLGPGARGNDANTDARPAASLVSAVSNAKLLDSGMREEWERERPATKRAARQRPQTAGPDVSGSPPGFWARTAPPPAHEDKRFYEAERKNGRLVSVHAVKRTMSPTRGRGAGKPAPSSAAAATSLPSATQKKLRRPQTASARLQQQKKPAQQHRAAASRAGRLARRPGTAASTRSVHDKPPAVSEQLLAQSLRIARTAGLADPVPILGVHRGGIMGGSGGGGGGGGRRPSSGSRLGSSSRRRQADEYRRPATTNRVVVTLPDASPSSLSSSARTNRSSRSSRGGSSIKHAGRKGQESVRHEDRSRRRRRKKHRVPKQEEALAAASEAAARAGRSSAVPAYVVARVQRHLGELSSCGGRGGGEGDADTAGAAVTAATQHLGWMLVDEQSCCATGIGVQGQPVRWLGGEAVKALGHNTTAAERQQRRANKGMAPTRSPIPATLRDLRREERRRRRGGGHDRGCGNGDAQEEEEEEGEGEGEGEGDAAGRPSWGLLYALAISGLNMILLFPSEEVCDAFLARSTGTQEQEQQVQADAEQIEATDNENQDGSRTAAADAATSAADDDNLPVLWINLELVVGVVDVKSAAFAPRVADFVRACSVAEIVGVPSQVLPGLALLMPAPLVWRGEDTPSQRGRRNAAAAAESDSGGGGRDEAESRQQQEEDNESGRPLGSVCATVLVPVPLRLVGVLPRTERRRSIGKARAEQAGLSRDGSNLQPVIMQLRERVQARNDALYMTLARATARRRGVHERDPALKPLLHDCRQPADPATYAPVLQLAFELILEDGHNADPALLGEVDEKEHGGSGGSGGGGDHNDGGGGGDDDASCSTAGSWPGRIGHRRRQRRRRHRGSDGPTGNEEVEAEDNDDDGAEFFDKSTAPARKVCAHLRRGGFLRNDSEAVQQREEARRAREARREAQQEARRRARDAAEVAARRKEEEEERARARREAEEAAWRAQQERARGEHEQEELRRQQEARRRGLEARKRAGREAAQARQRAKREALEKAEAERVRVATPSAVRLQQTFRRRRGRAILEESHFVDGEVHDIDPELVDLADDVAPTTIDAQAQVAWAWDNDAVRTLDITRGCSSDDEDGWRSQSLGLQAEMPGQVDLTYHGFELRVSDPFLVVQGLADDSYLHAFGLRPGDAVLTVNGQPFETIGEFAALTRETRNMVWEVTFLPTTPILELYRRRVKNAILMRVGHEVKVRDAFEHAHEHEIEHEERFVPPLASDRVHTLDSLRGFLVLQAMNLREQEQVGEAPMLCAIVTAVEETGALPRCSRRGCGSYAQPSAQEWLAAKLAAWRARIRGPRADGSQPPAPAPSRAFRCTYEKFVQHFPKDYGRCDVALAAEEEQQQGVASPAEDAGVDVHAAAGGGGNDGDGGNAGTHVLHPSRTRRSTVASDLALLANGGGGGGEGGGEPYSPTVVARQLSREYADEPGLKLSMQILGVGEAELVNEEQRAAAAAAATATEGSGGDRH